MLTNNDWSMEPTESLPKENNLIQLITHPDWVYEMSTKFLQAMCNSMGMSFYKYGKVEDAYPDKVDAIACLKKRLERYEETGNADYLVDVANFAMIEFGFPKHKNAHHKANDSHESPGRKFHGEIDFSERGNKEI